MEPALSVCAGTDMSDSNLPWLSVVIPVRNEAGRLPKLLTALQTSLPNAELIVVDGASDDASTDVAKQFGARVLASIANRGLQCQLGAQAASGVYVLFLHADCELEANAEQKLLATLQIDLENGKAGQGLEVGKLAVHFASHQWRYRLLEWCCRFDSVLTSYGDQGILVRREFLLQHQLMPDFALFEDVRFFQNARRITRVRRLPIRLSTSVRRFERLGFCRTHWRNTALILRYLLGVAPSQLHQRYYR
jgi:rSAM/selenodomain-associated transferase 2